ncbi:hypothetical protein [uncultured Psychrobacter sp.]|uniref:hypothetical protein n=1 Tax=uncultured Psychrobacter sp. TaxID=259303 RepID=UPI00345920E6
MWFIVLSAVGGVKRKKIELRLRKKKTTTFIIETYSKSRGGGAVGTIIAYLEPKK